MKFCIVGSGFTGCILANHLAEQGYSVDVYESRDHIGGNCYTYRDSHTNILVHKYGPHIFHTDNVKVWNFVNNLTNFVPYINRVKATLNGKVYSLPINLHTINQFFEKSLSPTEAKKFIKDLSVNIPVINSFEDQALAFVGEDLYNAFFKGYTIKQWGISPKKLPSSILKRLPLRFNYNDNYFNHKFQGMPVDGYTPIFEKLLGHPNINLLLKTSYSTTCNEDYHHVFFTGPIDSYFDYKFGRLAYRTLDFKEEIHLGDYQGCAVMNYNEENVPYTRITEHKHFAPHESHDSTIIYKEYSRFATDEDIEYYPIRQVDDKDLLLSYINEAHNVRNVSFLGRLGTYRYLDMDVTVLEALNASEAIDECLKSNKKIPVFFNEVL